MADYEGKDQERETVWDRAFREMARARSEGVRPDLSQFEGLTKATGARK